MAKSKKKTRKKQVDQNEGILPGLDASKIEKGESLASSSSKATVKPPDFLELLNNPKVQEKLPSDFSPKDEAKHLSGLWQRVPSLQSFEFLSFIHAGGSGIVFHVLEKGLPDRPRALKIARKKLLVEDAPENASTSLSPVAKSELNALDKLSHPNIVRLYQVISDPDKKDRYIAISTTLVPGNKQLSSYFKHILAQHPSSKAISFGGERLEKACGFLWEKILEMAKALEYMHAKNVYQMSSSRPIFLLQRDQIKRSLLI